MSIATASCRRFSTKAFRVSAEMSRLPRSSGNPHRFTSRWNVGLRPRFPVCRLLRRSQNILSCLWHQCRLGMWLHLLSIADISFLDLDSGTRSFSPRGSSQVLFRKELVGQRGNQTPQLFFERLPAGTLDGVFPTGSFRFSWSRPLVRSGTTVPVDRA
jgi:hypothetical protein